MIKKMFTFKSTFVALMLLLVLPGCTKWKEYAPGKGGTEKLTIAQIVASAPDFSQLKLAVTRAGLVEALNQSGALTVFAPDNKAFAASGFPDAASIESVPVETLKGILLYHVIGSKITAAQVPTGNNTPVTTLQGKDVFVTKKGSKISVNGAEVIKADIIASNGVIHAIDRVLMPPTANIVGVAQGNPNFTYLVAAVLRASEGATNVAAALSGNGPLTVFAPTNDAFVKAGFPTIESIKAADPNVLASILTYHVIGARVFSSNLVNNSMPATLNGKTVTIKVSEAKATVKGLSNNSPSNIVITDLLATNGVVHVIDQVLLP